MTYSVEYYQSLITSQHQSAPKYMAWIAALVEPFTVIQTVAAQMAQSFDVDTAVGVQLDTVGLWVGVSRYLPTEITGVFATFDTADLGFDQGIMRGPFDSSTGLTRMPDHIYRIMIQFQILANQWDGTIPGAYEAMNTVFNGSAHVFLIDNQDMSMTVGFAGINFGPLGIGILEQGYFPFKPEGVRIREYIIDPGGNKIAAFDLDNEIFAGFDKGYFPTKITPSP